MPYFRVTWVQQQLVSVDVEADTPEDAQEQSDLSNPAHWRYTELEYVFESDEVEEIDEDECLM